MLGGFFALHRTPDEAGDGQPLSALLTPGSPALHSGVERARAALAAQAGVPVAAVEPRVAASLWSLGWATRLLSPWLAEAVVTGGVPIGSASAVHWQDGSGQPVPLSVAAGTRSTEPVDDPLLRARAVEQHCLVPLVAPLLAATGAAYPVSDQVLWGNAASAVGGAAELLGRLEPGLAAGAEAVARALLSGEPLRERSDWPAGGRFARRTCCLLYRVPGAGLCGDCVLRGR